MSIVSDPKLLAGARELGAEFPEREEKFVVPLTFRSPDEILGMEFDESDNIMGDRLLAKGQSATLLGPPGAGKSRLVLQMAGFQILQKRFLGFDMHGEPLRWLFIQGENSNRRLQKDLLPIKKWAGDYWPEISSRLTIHTLETDDDSFLNIDNPMNSGRLAAAIEEYRPDITVWDVLNEFATGDLNKDKDMRLTCQLLSMLAKAGNVNRATIVLHHALTGRAGASKATGYDRSSFGRNSKVLQAWTRAAINISPGAPDNNDTLVLSCGKCSNGREFAPFAARLNPSTMIYEIDSTFDLSAWESEVMGKRSEEIKVTVQTVAELCKEPMKKPALVKAIINETGCGRSYAYRIIGKALTAKKLHHNKVDDNYLGK
jgi:hypothetical protein